MVDGLDPSWDGDLLISSLRARTLYRARIDEDRVVFMEEIEIGQRIRDAMQIAPDKLALWLDTEEVVILTVEERIDPLEDVVADLQLAGIDAGLAGRAHDVLTGCVECHSLQESVHGAGPSLHNVYGRDIASTAFASYSPALRAMPGTWDEAALTAYLMDPSAVAPGTSMSGLGIGNAEVTGAVVAAFRTLTGEAAVEE